MAGTDDLFSAGGEAGALMRSIDWAKNPLGPVEHWSATLRTTVPIMLASRFAMRVLWGPELILLYNDGYRPILGASKHPSAMGSTERVVAERGIRALHDVATVASTAETAAHACRLVAEALAGCSEDAPFALFYLLDSDGKTARLASSIGLAEGSRGCPAVVDVGASGGTWPLDLCSPGQKIRLIANIASRFGPIHAGPYPEPISARSIHPSSSRSSRTSPGWVER